MNASRVAWASSPHVAPERGSEISRGWSNAEPPGPMQIDFRPGRGGRSGRDKARGRAVLSPLPGLDFVLWSSRGFRCAPPPANFCRPSGPWLMRRGSSLRLRLI